MQERIQHIWEKAKKNIGNNEKLANLVTQVKEKLHLIKVNPEEKKKFTDSLGVLSRMVRAHYKGEYVAFSRKTLFLITFALVYFITPVDLLPDFIPALGYSDDISIIMYVVKSIADDIQAFQSWELEQVNG